MIININNTNVTINLVTFDSTYAGYFRKDAAEIVLVQPYRRGVLIHELTHAYLHYFGFSGADLNEELICNFFEIYGERIMKDVKDYERSKSL